MVGVLGPEAWALWGPVLLAVLDEECGGAGLEDFGSVEELIATLEELGVLQQMLIGYD